MATKKVYLSGTCNWAKLHVPDTKFDVEGVYTIDMYLDEASKAKFQEAGIRVDEREDKEGHMYVRFKRQHKKLIKGEVKTQGPPQVLDKEGEPFNGLVGNGSKVTCKVAVFDTMKGKGHTLEAVRVDELVAYEKPDANGGAPF